MHQDFTRDVGVSAPVGAVWGALTDFRRVASWLSIVGDVRELEPLRRYRAVLEDRVGPFAMRADLEVAVVANADEHRLHVAAAGEDRQIASRIAASVDLATLVDGAGTRLTVVGRYEITGRIATLGAGAIRKKGEKVLEEFMTSVTRELGGT